jgi:hypothetical protein
MNKVYETIEYKGYTIEIWNEIEECESYIRGDTYGWTVRHPDGEGYDSIGGYIGDTKYPIQDAKASIDNLIEYDRKQMQAKLKQYIKSNVPINYRWA